MPVSKLTMVVSYVLSIQMFIPTQYPPSVFPTYTYGVTTYIIYLCTYDTCKVKVGGFT